MTMQQPMTDPAGASEPRRSLLPTRLEAIVLLPNLALVAFVVLYLVTQQSSTERVAPLVEGDRALTDRIAQLEQSLQREPSNISSAVELARLYREVGEFPWSYSALRNAEREGKPDPSWRLLLGLAYLELGKNKDANRVLEQSLRRCEQPPRCASNVKARLEIFARVARLFEERKIDARKHNAAAEKAMHEVLKPVEVDPDKMRPKGPAAPSPAPRPEQAGPS